MLGVGSDFSTEHWTLFQLSGLVWKHQQIDGSPDNNSLNQLYVCHALILFHSSLWTLVMETRLLFCII